MRKTDIRACAMLGILTFVSFSVLAFALFAAAPDQAEEIKETSAPLNPDKKIAGIVVDNEAGVVRILIDGTPMLVIDSSGIEIFGDVRYSGNIRRSGVDADPGGKKLEREPDHAQ